MFFISLRLSYKSSKGKFEESSEGKVQRAKGCPQLSPLQELSQLEGTFILKVLISKCLRHLGVRGVSDAADKYSDRMKGINLCLKPAIKARSLSFSILVVQYLLQPSLAAHR